MGVRVVTVVHTPRFWGESWSIAERFLEFHPFKSAGALDFLMASDLPFLTSWLKVGIQLHLLLQIFYMRISVAPFGTRKTP